MNSVIERRRKLRVKAARRIFDVWLLSDAGKLWANDCDTASVIVNIRTGSVTIVRNGLTVEHPVDVDTVQISDLGVVGS